MPLQEQRTIKLITTREEEVINLLSKGKTAKEIANELFLSHRTVENHLASAKDKLNANNSAHLIALAFKNRIINI